MKCRNCVHLYRDWCLHKLDSPDPDLDRECKDYKQATNADRIRAMSNEELAKLLCIYDWRLGEMDECLAWLQQPVEEGT